MSNSCQKITAVIVLSAAILLFIIQGVAFMKFHEYQQTNCLITNVTYPQSVTDSNNLITCNCGRRCKSDAGTCIRITGRISNKRNEKLFVASVTTNIRTHQCTFAETKCKDGEKIENRIAKIESVKQYAQKYINIQNDQSTIPCFYRNQEKYLYLENPDNSIIFYISCGFFGLSIVLASCCFCRCKEQETQPKSQFI